MLAEFDGLPGVAEFDGDADGVDGDVDPVADTSEPEGAKGLETLIGWLAVRLGKEGLRAVIAAVVNWATRSGHSIVVTIDGDVLKVSGVTSAQQERVINDFLARHAPRP